MRRYVRWPGRGSRLATGCQQKTTRWITAGAGEQRKRQNRFVPLTPPAPTLTPRPSSSHTPYSPSPLLLRRLNSMSERELFEANSRRGFCKHLLTWLVTT